MRLIDADALKEKLQEHHDFIENAWKENGVAHIDIPVPDKSRLDEIINSIAEVVNAPNVKAYTRAELEAWLYEIALNNFGNSLERACVELISRLDGFERFVEDKRKETRYDMEKSYRI